MASRISDIGCPRGADREAAILTQKQGKRQGRAASKPARGTSGRKGSWRSIPMLRWSTASLFLCHRVPGG